MYSVQWGMKKQIEGTPKKEIENTMANIFMSLYESPEQLNFKYCVQLWLVYVEKAIWLMNGAG